MSASGCAILIERAERALANHFADPAAVWDPLLTTVVRYLDEAKGGGRDRAPIIHRLEGNARVRGFRWPMDWFADPANPMSWERRPGQDPVVWRPVEAQGGRDADHAARLMHPLILVEELDFLEDTVAQPDLELVARQPLGQQAQLFFRAAAIEGRNDLQNTFRHDRNP